MIRLGFAVRVVGRPGLGAGRPAHLSVGLARLGDVLGYLDQINVHFYRLPPALLPAGGSAELNECGAQLTALAHRLAASATRLTLHLDFGAALGGTDDARAGAGIAAIERAAALLERLDARRAGGAAEGTLVAHVGGPADDPDTLTRFVARYAALSSRARARLAIEHDHAGHSLGQLLALHRRCGVPIVFDALHWEVWNPERLPLGLALGLALATWPVGVRPEVHLSSQRSEAHLLPARAGQPAAVLPPRLGQHADFVDVGALVRLLNAARGLPAFDLMIEAKAGDLALQRLRAEIAHRAPQVARALG